MSLQFARFCIVGFLGFAADFTILESLIAFGFSPPFARIYSILFALQLTFLLHRTFTFRVQLPWRRAWVKFMIANALGALVNYATFVFLLHFLAYPIALVIATAVALFFNYWANIRFVFRGRR